MTNVLITTIRTPTGDIQGSQTVTAEAALELDVPLLAETEQEIILPITLAQAKAISLYSATAITIKTNSNSAPDDTIALQAGIPLAWGDGGYAACPITADVTSVFAESATATTLQIRVLYDPTA